MGNKNYIRISTNRKSCREKKIKSGVGFDKEAIKTAVTFLIVNSDFNISNISMKEMTDIAIGINSTSFCGNLFLYSYEEEYMSSLISSDKVKATHFTINFCTINHSGEFEKTFLGKYKKELELMVEHQDNHGCFLNLEISVSNKIFVYKLFDKRDTFPFTPIQMSYI